MYDMIDIMDTVWKKEKTGALPQRWLSTESKAEILTDYFHKKASPLSFQSCETMTIQSLGNSQSRAHALNSTASVLVHRHSVCRGRLAHTPKTQARSSRARATLVPVQVSLRWLWEHARTHVQQIQQIQQIHYWWWPTTRHSQSGKGCIWGYYFTGTELPEFPGGFRYPGRQWSKFKRVLYSLLIREYSGTLDIAQYTAVYWIFYNDDDTNIIYTLLCCSTGRQKIGSEIRVHYIPEMLSCRYGLNSNPSTHVTIMACITRITYTRTYCRIKHNIIMMYTVLATNKLRLFCLQ